MAFYDGTVSSFKGPGNGIYGNTSAALGPASGTTDPTGGLGGGPNDLQLEPTNLPVENAPDATADAAIFLDNTDGIVKRTTIDNIIASGVGVDGAGGLAGPLTSLSIDASTLPIENVPVGSADSIVFLDNTDGAMKRTVIDNIVTSGVGLNATGGLQGPLSSIALDITNLPTGDVTAPSTSLIPFYHGTSLVHSSQTWQNIANATVGPLANGGIRAISADAIEIDFQNITLENGVTSADDLLFNDSGVGLRQTSIANVVAAAVGFGGVGGVGGTLAGISLDYASLATSATLDAPNDEMAFLDATDATEKKTSITNIVAAGVGFAANPGLTGAASALRLDLVSVADGTLDHANDYIVFHDVTDGLPKKTFANNVLPPFSTTTTLDRVNDYALIEDATTGFPARILQSLYANQLITNATNGGLTSTNGDLSLNIADLTAKESPVDTGADSIAWTDATDGLTYKMLFSSLSTALGIGGGDVSVLTSGTFGIDAVTAPTGTTNPIVTCNWELKTTTTATGQIYCHLHVFQSTVVSAATWTNTSKLLVSDTAVTNTAFQQYSTTTLWQDDSNAADQTATAATKTCSVVMTGASAILNFEAFDTPFDAGPNDGFRIAGFDFFYRNN